MTTRGLQAAMVACLLATSLATGCGSSSSGQNPSPATCGGSGQACCATGSSCNTELTCQNGTCGSAPTGFSAPGYVVAFPLQAVLGPGGRYSLDVAAYADYGSSTTPPPLTSSNPQVATIQGNLVTAVAAGRSNIMGGSPSRVLSTVVVLTSAPDVGAGTATQLGVTPPTLQMAVGTRRALGAKPYDMTGRLLAVAVAYSSSDPTVASVTADGVVTAISQGSADIIVVVPSSPRVQGTATVYVSPTAVGPGQPNCQPETVAVAGNGFSRVKLWAGRAGFDDVRWVDRSCIGGWVTTNIGTWTSTHPEVASVDSLGRVTPHRCGLTRIVFKPKPLGPNDRSDLSSSSGYFVTPDWSGSWSCTELPSIASCRERAAATFIPIMGSAPFLSTGFSDPVMNRDPTRFEEFKVTESSFFAELHGQGPEMLPACIPNTCFSPWTPEKFDGTMPWPPDDVGIVPDFMCDTDSVTYTMGLRKIQCVRQAYAAVCNGNGLSTPTGFFAILGQYFATASSTFQHANPAFFDAPNPLSNYLKLEESYVHTEIGALHTSYDPAAAPACLGAVQTGTARLFSEVSPDTFATRVLPDACRGVFPGRVADGGTCYQDHECQLNSYCDSFNVSYSITGAIDGCPGACRPYSVLGGSCACTGSGRNMGCPQCAPGLACDWAGGAPTDTCIARGAAGQRCEGHRSYCKEGLFCAADPLAPRTSPYSCKVQPTAGSCDPMDTATCARDHLCVGSPPSCKPIVGLNGSCSESPELCAPGYDCVTGRCVSAPVVGRPCIANCQGGYCEPLSKTCAPYKALGDACQPDNVGSPFSSQCITMLCSGGRCVSALCAP